jgi:hypothetical protein
MTLLDYIRDKREEALRAGFILKSITFHWNDMGIITMNIEHLPQNEVKSDPSRGLLEVGGVGVRFDMRVPVNQAFYRLDSLGK